MASECIFKVKKILPDEEQSSRSSGFAARGYLKTGYRSLKIGTLINQSQYSGEDEEEAKQSEATLSLSLSQADPKAEEAEVGGT